MGNLHAVLRKAIQTTSKSRRESYAEQGPHCRGCPDDGGSLHPVLAGESITGHGDDGKTPQREPADRDIGLWEQGCSQRETGFLRYCRGRHLPAPRRGLSLTRGCPGSLPERPEEHDRRGVRPAQIAVPARIRGTTGRTRQLAVLPQGLRRGRRVRLRPRRGAGRCRPRQ